MMRLAMAVLILFPAGASACEGGHACDALAVSLMAAVAGLGVWVLRSAEKDSGSSKRAGQAVGWALVVVGLLGFLCGAVNHALKGRSRSCHSPSSAPSTKLPLGHPPIGPSSDDGATKP